MSEAPLYPPYHGAQSVRFLWSNSPLQTTQGQMDGFFSQLPCKCHLPEVAFVGD